MRKTPWARTEIEALYIASLKSKKIVTTHNYWSNK
ncbi:VF530 family DNA-binding protein [Legionella moravica]|nr:VF530 family DNA-binding protein [Legionella moravica]